MKPTLTLILNLLTNLRIWSKSLVQRTYCIMVKCLEYAFWSDWGTVNLGFICSALIVYATQLNNSFYLEVYWPGNTLKVNMIIFIYLFFWLVTLWLEYKFYLLDWVHFMFFIYRYYIVLYIGYYVVKFYMFSTPYSYYIINTSWILILPIFTSNEAKKSLIMHHYEGTGVCSHTLKTAVREFLSTSTGPLNYKELLVSFNKFLCDYCQDWHISIAFDFWRTLGNLLARNNPDMEYTGSPLWPGFSDKPLLMAALGVLVTGLSLGPGGISYADFLNHLSKTFGYPISWPLGFHDVVWLSTDRADYYLNLPCFGEYIPLVLVIFGFRYIFLGPYLNSIQPILVNKGMTFSEPILRLGYSVREHLDVLYLLAKKSTHLHAEGLSQIPLSQNQALVALSKLELCEGVLSMTTPLTSITNHLSTAEINTLLLQLLVITLMQVDFNHEILLQVLNTDNGVFKLLYLYDLLQYSVQSGFLTTSQLSIVEPQVSLFYSFLESEEFLEACGDTNDFYRRQSGWGFSRIL